jgi:hypothetical protein
VHEVSEEYIASFSRVERKLKLTELKFSTPVDGLDRSEI